MGLPVSLLMVVVAILVIIIVILVKRGRREIEFDNRTFALNELLTASNIEDFELTRVGISGAPASDTTEWYTAQEEPSMVLSPPKGESTRDDSMV